MEEKTALITGASSGLGRSLAHYFGIMGYNLILSGRDKKKLNEVIKILPDNGLKIIVQVGDITLPETISALGKTAKEWGVDVLINNAGIYAKRSLAGMTPEAVKRIFDTNLLAPILLTQRIYPIFRERGKGLVININSVAGKEPSHEETIYSASKHGLRGFSRSLQFEAGEENIRIIDYYFGAMKTPMAKGRISFEQFMDPAEVAAIIYATSVEYKSARLKEIEIGRKNYQ